jgi:hypothetical protein
MSNLQNRLDYRPVINKESYTLTMRRITYHVLYAHSLTEA